MPEEQLEPPEPDDPTREGDDAPAAASAAPLLWRRLACGLVGLQAVLLALGALISLLNLLTGGDWQSNALVGGLFLLTALGLLLIARELLRGHARVRTPGVFFQALLLLLVPSMWSAGNPLLAAGVGVLAGTAVVSIVLATRRA
ncbi:hypothetical protein [Angustibacter luteus]|uniref:Integral membrane protein n=2 Tax=Angustibacter luteus TaxID=658456 RepID=A0ABW1JK47_9ACTN